MPIGTCPVVSRAQLTLGRDIPGQMSRCVPLCPDGAYSEEWDFFPFLSNFIRILLLQKWRNPLMKAKPRPISAADQGAVLAKATLRAATQLGLTNKELAAVIGVSAATVSRMRDGKYMLHSGQKP